jgi:hypothetical protein
LEAFAITLGLFWFAWTNSPSTNSVFSVMAGAPFDLAWFSLFFTATNYLIDAYGVFSAPFVFSTDKDALSEIQRRTTGPPHTSLQNWKWETGARRGHLGSCIILSCTYNARQSESQHSSSSGLEIYLVRDNKTRWNSWHSHG